MTHSKLIEDLENGKISKVRLTDTYSNDRYEYIYQNFDFQHNNQNKCLHTTRQKVF